ncbi:hypothetical protein [Marisediminicola sp. LYQ134]|uniref:hypothetical protein n=1 Tax=Marisediminicola sp. LYQ134 TaxID=3391061 RepID=UPI0039837345
MGIEGVGSSVVIALAAVLWLVYLMPTWFRRREYVATERNAVRLQQTLRILAETAEVPEPIHVESTAKSIAAQQRVLRQEFERQRAVERARAAAMSRAATRTLASLTPVPATEILAHSRAAARLRRSRALTTGFLALCLATIAATFTPLLAGVASAVVVLASLGAVAAVSLLVVMATVSRKRMLAAARVSSVSAPAVAARTVAPEVVAPHEPAAWTPVPLPKPLYLSKPAPQAIVSEASVIAERTRVLEEADRAERAAIAAERAEKVTPIRQSAPARQTEPGAADSRFARMGIVDAGDTRAPDLDAALRRRRAV